MIASPCIGTCKVDPNSNICIGCFRTVYDIVNWPTLSDAEKQLAVDEAQKRKQSEQRCFFP